MIKINESLNVFDAERHDLESPLNTNLKSLKNGSAHKSGSKKDSTSKRKSRLKVSRNKNSNFGGSYSKNYLINFIAHRKSNEPRYKLLYQHAQEVQHRLARARKEKLEEEMKKWTFHPKREHEPKFSALHSRSNSVHQNTKEIIMSLERLVPSKDQMHKRYLISEENAKQREQLEIDKWTFTPSFVQTSIDRDKKIDNVPGIENHVLRMKISQEEYNRRKTYFDNLGHKYKGETTDPEPFSFVKDIKLLGKEKNIPSTKATPRELKKDPIARPSSETSKSPVKNITKNNLNKHVLKSDNSKVRIIFLNKSSISIK